MEEVRENEVMEKESNQKLMELVENLPHMSGYTLDGGINNLLYRLEMLSRIIDVQDDETAHHDFGEGATCEVVRWQQDILKEIKQIIDAQDKKIFALRRFVGSRIEGDQQPT